MGDIARCSEIWRDVARDSAHHGANGTTALALALALAVTLTRSPNPSPNPNQEPFARRRPELNVSSVKVMNILSDASKEKNIDTAKAYLGLTLTPYP